MLVDRQTFKMAAADSSAIPSVTFSDYYADLTGPAKTRYREKVVACGFDPYVLKKSDCSDELASFPSVGYPDIVNYLVLQTSWITGEQMKAYKSMEAYNFFVSGWVNTILTKSVAGTDKTVVTARVNHSQRCRETPLKTWFLAQKDGNVCMAHCNCMAGLCEACSHVGALLFAVEAGVRIRNSVTCTQDRNPWILPSYVKNIPYIPVCDMDLSSAKKRYSTLGEQGYATPEVNRADIPETSAEERANFCGNISRCGIKPAILSLISPYNAAFMPNEAEALPKPLTVIYNEEHLNYSFQELVEKAEKVFDEINITAKEAEAVEGVTRGQSTCKVWFEHRAGRVTASKFRAACTTDPDKPLKSLIEMICYPNSHRFSNAATKWGISNGSRAREDYAFSLAEDHLNFSVADCGLHISAKWPFLGATPDGLVFCECCGKGICEIKCPYKYKDSMLVSAAKANDSSFCLKYNEEEMSLSVDTCHAYYYQVQCKLFVTGVEYCDFVVWTNKDIFIQRILPDTEFWDRTLTRAILFYKKGVLPELLGRWFSRSSPLPHATVTPASDSDDDGPWCYCQQYIEGSQLIGCDKPDCKIQWFHMSCVGLTTEPDGEWICPSCTQ
ncbi:uncharacterized protein [Montipora capricornis]|uniref:uncharacterized protein n=1 Tax=Montipora capricornis TaxID=246305 RepID=UPI0035F1B120